MIERYAIEFLQSAAKSIRKLDRPIQKRLLKAIEGLAVDPRPPGNKALKGGEGLFRIRVQDYRVLYEIQDGRLLVLVVSVGHRREVYR